jgi:ABC-type branched-subunit amino acid transport system substrate-binding protein
LHYTFYLLPGARLQGFALIDYAATRIPDVGLPVAIVHPEGEAAAALAESMRTHARDQGWWRVRLESYAPGAMDPVALAGKLHDSGTQVMFFLGSGAEFKTLAQAVDRLGWAPFTFLQGVRTSREVFDTPERFAGRLFIAYPTSPQDQTAAARREFNAFRQRHGLPAQHAAVQMTAYAGAQLLVHGLKASGRTLTRERLVKALEALYRYETGLIPPLTFGPNRRVGVHGAQIVAVDLANRRFLPGSTWVELK